MSADKENAQDSEWQQIAYVNQNTSLLFLRDVKRYVKIVVEFTTSSSLSEVNFLLLVEVQIEEILSPVISSHTKNILNRFPSWTKTFSDSLAAATPELATPVTNAGKFVNALIGDSLDKIDEFISKIELDSFIDSANINEISWMYLYAPIAPGFIKITGDRVELARLSTMKELLEHRDTDYVFYYNYLTRELYTLKKFEELKVDQIEYSSIPVQTINSFDDFGLRVGLQRLYLEGNANFAKRILDVAQNPPAINEDGLKLTLRRELDIWRAVGATPDSDYLGATPEVIEIEDMQLMSKYFSKDGIPTKEFYDFVEYINIKYPSNLGYIKWGQAYWDYAGKRKEGISSIPQITDSATPDSYIEVYQPGVGDFEDAKLSLEKVDQLINNYSFGLIVEGLKWDGYAQAYEPISIKYDSYLSYLENYVDNQAATVNYDVTLKLNLHGDIPNDAVYKARYKATVKNLQDSNSSSSPEFIVRSIFNPAGFTNGESVYYNNDGTPYINTFNISATESYTFSEIPLYSVDEATISFINSTNEAGANGDYAWIGFLNATPNQLATSTNSTIVKTAAQINDSPYSMNVKIASKIYDPKKTRSNRTPKIRSDRFGNVLNNSSNIENKSPIVFTPQDILKDIVVPYGVTPQYVHIENVIEDSYTVDHSSGYYSGYGGLSRNRDTNDVHLIPSSPNIIFSFVNPNFSTPEQMPNYIDTVVGIDFGSTANYYFADIKFPYDATPEYLAISSADTGVYPFNTLNWEFFTANYNSEIDFWINENGVVQHYSTGNYDLTDSYNTDLVGIFDFQRSDFGLQDYASTDNLLIYNVHIENENDDVYIYTERNQSDFYNQLDENNNVTTVVNALTPILGDEATPSGLLNYRDPLTGNYMIKGLRIKAINNDLKNYYVRPSIKTGWYYQNGEERYIYAKPETGISFSNNTLILSKIARQGAPIIVDIYNAELGGTPDSSYTQVSFFDEATPTQLSYYNYEYLTPKYDNYLPLAYTDVFDLKIVDQFTGETIVENESSTTNIINYLDSATPILISGREYKVTYRVNNSFNIDNEYYNDLDNSYRTKITLLSTPSYNYYYIATYESAKYDDDTELDEVVLNPLYSPIDEGFVYLSHNSYPLASIEASMSPKDVVQETKDFMALNIWSKDSNGNPKPYTYVDIFGPNSSATPSFAYTNVDGYARAYVRYVGENTAAPSVEQVFITSEDDSYSATVSYRAMPNIDNSNKLSAEVTKKIVNADGEETQYIYGNATPNAAVYWRKGRTLFEALNLEYSTSTQNPGKTLASGVTSADQNGNFKIGPYIAQNDATPGYWFVVVDSEFDQLIEENPITIAGDIVYWYERYDVNQSSSEEPVLSAVGGSATGYYHYLTNPVFKKDQFTNVVYYENTYQDLWNLPSWYPIARYTQYQMGALSSTPYWVDTYENLRPDYEEE